MKEIIVEDHDSLFDFFESQGLELGGGRLTGISIRINNGEILGMIAVLGRRIVPFVKFSPIVHFIQIAVREEYRKMGIGQELFRHFFEMINDPSNTHIQKIYSRLDKEDIPMMKLLIKFNFFPFRGDLELWERKI